MSKIEQLYSHIKNSAFSKSAAYSVNVEFTSLFAVNSGMAMYNDALNDELKLEFWPSNEVIAYLTPKFQRSNTKWSQLMQIQFVENLLSGCDTKLQMYTIIGSGSELGSCFILDGLQRSTAISDYHLDKFPIFGDIYWSDIKTKMRNRLRLQLSIYQFDSERDAVEFYIQMNKGITHNEDDLVPAYAYLETLN